VRDGAIVLLSALAVAGTLTTAQSLATEAIAMNGNHWIMLLVAVAAGYVAGRLFAKPAQMIGLP
jgi:ABC-type uncharacterized transport system permease subunit